MGKIVPKRVLEDIRFRNDIVEFITSYVPLKRAGSSFKACCPFHKEKTPSFHVNPQRQIFHCFGCRVGGDVFAFVMKYEGMDFMGAVRMLAERAGIVLEVEDDDGSGSDKAALYKLHAEVAALYHKALLERKSAAAARDYLASRELTADTIEAFQIGYAPDRWDAVLKLSNLVNDPIHFFNAWAWPWIIPPSKDVVTDFPLCTWTKQVHGCINA